LAGVIHKVRKATHTVYCYDSLMLAIIATIILTLTQTQELERQTVPNTCVVYWLAIG